MDNYELVNQIEELILKISASQRPEEILSFEADLSILYAAYGKSIYESYNSKFANGVLLEHLVKRRLVEYNGDVEADKRLTKTQS